MTPLHNTAEIPATFNQSLDYMSERQACTGVSASLFRDNMEHIEYLVMEVRAWVALAFLRIKGLGSVDPSTPELQFLELPADVTGPEEAYHWYTHLEKCRKAMEAASLNKGIQLNFLTVCQQYGLDVFETRVLQFLFAVDTSIDLCAMLNRCNIDTWETDRNDIDVGTVLSILTDGYTEQIEKRRYFSATATLVQQDIVRIDGWSTARIIESCISIHARISNFILGDNNIYDESMLCFTTEAPTIDIDSVIIDPEIRDDLVRYAKAFLQQDRQSQAISDSFQYGTALTCLFHGPSGTGKTMLANAIASHLGCSIFNLNIGELDHLDISFSRALRTVFREAQLAGGIVFLDECDDVLQDSSPMSRTFLIEIEKAMCITILATNRPVKLDPAMDRRISLKIPFSMPDARNRRLIWEVLLPEGTEYAPDVDLDELASRYQFSGGLIKNTLVMAANRAAVTATQDGKTVLTASEIHNAAEYQAKSMFDTAGTVSHPDMSIAALPVHKRKRAQFARVAEIISECHRLQQGFSMLIDSRDIETGRVCIEAILSEAGFIMRRFSDEDIFRQNRDTKGNSLFDPLTQEQVSVMDYVFSNREGIQQASVILDITGEFRRCLAETDEPGDSTFNSFIEKVEQSAGILFLVTSLEDKSRVPLAFSYFHDPGLSHGRAADTLLGKKFQGSF